MGDKEPCEVKMVIKDGKLTATGDKKADVKVVSSKFDGKGEPTEIKLELIPKGAKGKPSLFFTCTIKDGDLQVSQDAPEKPTSAAPGAPAEPAEPTEQELVVRFKLDPNKDPCVVKIGILGDECAAIGDKQASAEVVDFKCSPNGDPEYIRLRLDPSDGSEGIFFVLRFVDGKLSVEQEDLPADADLGNMGLQHSSAEQGMVVRFKLSPDDPNPCEVVLRMTPENCTASSDGKANVNVMEYVCNNDGDPELIKLQLTPQGSTESLYFILRFVDGQVNVESVDAPADARKKLNAKDFPAKLLSLKMLLKETDKVPVELNLKCQGPLVSAAEPSEVYRVLSTEPNKEGIAEVINVQITHPKTGEIYLLRMKMVGDQVSIEGVEMFDLDKIDQYLKICFPNNANKIKEIKKELAKTDKKDVLKVVLQHGARGTVVTTGNVTFDIGPMKEILRKINVASSFDDNDGYTMESFGDDEGYTLEAPKDKKPIEATPVPASEEKPKAEEKPKPEEKPEPEEKKAPSKPKKPWEKTPDEAKQEKKQPAWKKKPGDKPAEEKPKRPWEKKKDEKPKRPWEKKKDEPKEEPKQEPKPEPKKDEPAAAPKTDESKPESDTPTSMPAESKPEPAKLVQPELLESEALPDEPDDSLPSVEEDIKEAVKQAPVAKKPADDKPKPEEKKAPSKPKKPWEKTPDEAKQEKKQP